MTMPRHAPHRQDDFSDPARLAEVVGRACAENDPAAWSELHARFNPGLLSMLREWTDAHAAEDIAQSAWVTAWRERLTFDPKRARFSTWLWVIARRRGVDHLRAHSRRVSVCGQVSPTVSHDDPATPERDQEKRCVRRCLSRMNQVDWQLLWESKVGGVPYRALLAATGFKNEGTARSRAAKVLARLRECVERCMRGDTPKDTEVPRAGDHPSDEALAELVLGGTTDRSRPVREHTAACTRCAQRSEALRDALDLLPDPGGAVHPQAFEACPDEMLLAGYIDRRLSPGESEDLDAHLGQCERCRAAMDLMQSAGHSAPASPRSSRRWPGAGLAAAASVIVFVMVWKGLPLRPFGEGRDAVETPGGSDLMLVGSSVVPDFALGLSPTVYTQCRPLGFLAPEAAARACDLFERAVAAQLTLDLETALDLYLTAIELAPSFTAARANLAVVLAQSGDVDGALAQIEALGEHTDAETLSSVGIALLQNDAAGAAIPLLNRATVLRPGYSEAAVARARAFCVTGQWAEAEAAIAPLLELPTADAESLFIGGYVAFQLNEFDTEVSRYRRAVERDPDAAKIWYNLGVALMNRGQTAKSQERTEDARIAFDQSVDAFRQAESLGILPAKTPYNIGIVYSLQERFSEAITAFERALEADPDSVQMHYVLGLAHVGNKNWSGVRAQAAQLRRLGHDDLAEELLLRIED